MICQRCGKESPADFSLCPSCGFPVVTAETPPPQAVPPKVSPEPMRPVSLCIALAFLFLGIALIVIPIAGTKGESALTGVSFWNVNAGAGALGLIVGVVTVFAAVISLLVLFSDRYLTVKSGLVGVMVLVLGLLGVYRAGRWAYGYWQDDARKLLQVEVGPLTFFKPSDWIDSGKEIEDVRTLTLQSAAGSFPAGAVPRIPYLSLSPDRAALFMVMESSLEDPNLASVWKDREQAHTTASSGGMIRDNRLERGTWGKLDVIYEEVTRTENGTRMCTTKFLVGSSLFDLSLVVRQPARWDNFKSRYDALLRGLTVEGKGTGKP